MMVLYLISSIFYTFAIMNNPRKKICKSVQLNLESKSYQQHKTLYNILWILTAKITIAICNYGIKTYFLINL